MARGVRYGVVSAVGMLGVASLAPLLVENPAPPIKSVVVRPVDDVAKAGRTHGLLGWHIFQIPAGTSGESQNQLRFEFTAAAEIVQIDLSVDIGDPRVDLVEFLVGVNSIQGYGLDRSATWLMHASWTRTSSKSDLEETTRLPSGVHVAAGDFVGVSAWLGGKGSGSSVRVSPEIVILYRWLDVL